MRLGDEGFPCVLLGHRKREFLETTVESLRTYGRGITDLIIVDDSGDPKHYEWLDDHGFQFSVVHPGLNRGYLEAMRKVWDVAHYAARKAGVDKVLLWEEDFVATRPFSTIAMEAIMDEEGNERLAQLNLQRQAVYRVERQHGYMNSHHQRGYGLSEEASYGRLRWVKRQRPFTTNPGLIRLGVLDYPWPTRLVADHTHGGAEPAMSASLENEGWYFGWYGRWDTPHTEHVGSDMKSGTGY